MNNIVALGVLTNVATYTDWFLLRIDVWHVSFFLSMKVAAWILMDLKDGERLEFDHLRQRHDLSLRRIRDG